MTCRMGLILVALLLGGCAGTNRYEWNQYDQKLYDYYKSPGTEQQFVSSMEAHVRALEATGKKPPPGMYAELGTFYFKLGDSTTAVGYYQKEMKAWPESKGFMTALIAATEKPKPKLQEGTQETSPPAMSGVPQAAPQPGEPSSRPGEAKP